MIELTRTCASISFHSAAIPLISINAPSRTSPLTTTPVAAGQGGPLKSRAAALRSFCSRQRAGHSPLSRQSHRGSPPTLRRISENFSKMHLVCATISPGPTILPWSSVPVVPDRNTRLPTRTAQEREARRPILLRDDRLIDRHCFSLRLVGATQNVESCRSRSWAGHPQIRFRGDIDAVRPTFSPK